MKTPLYDDKHCYRVGWLSAIKRRRLRSEFRRLRHMIRDRKWRAIKQSFNGWLYEPEPWPETARRCGSGWTKNRAVRSFWRHWDRELRSAHQTSEERYAEQPYDWKRDGL